MSTLSLLRAARAAETSGALGAEQELYATLIAAPSLDEPLAISRAPEYVASRVVAAILDVPADERDGWLAWLTDYARRRGWVERLRRVGATVRP
jgi:hypothetical protein